jgi:glucosylceramidase
MHIFRNYLFPALLLLSASSLAMTQQVESYRTTPDLSEALTYQPAIAFQTPAQAQQPATNSIEVDEQQRFQTIDGFGASITDSAAWLLHDQLNASTRHDVLRKLFDPRDGIGLSFLRQPFGATDLSRNHYSYDDQPAGKRDPGIEHFSLQHDDAYILPTLREALKINPSIYIMATPWSPPGWMKTHGTMIGGSLREDAMTDYAAYLVKSLQGYRQAGVPIQYLSVQNEPLYETKNYPGTLMLAAQQKRLIGEYLGPALQKAGLKTKILAYDHNWDHPEYAIEVLEDAKANPFVAGSALHCYGGDPSTQEQIHERFPNKGIWLTECSGGTWQKGNLLAVTAQLIIDSTRNWAKSVVLWGMVLDDNNGPNAGGCDTCRGFITVHHAQQPSTASYTVDYYAMGTASKFVRPGATRIASTTSKELQSVAFQNVDQSIVVLVLNNEKTEAAFTLHWHGHTLQSSLPGGSFAAYKWTPAK